MTVHTDLENSNIYRKIGQYLISNPDAIKEEDIAGTDRYTRDMVRIHVYYAKNAVKQQNEIDELIKKVKQLEEDVAYLDSIKANKE
jgi:serine/threonine-protein kinase RIO1